MKKLLAILLAALFLLSALAACTTDGNTEDETDTNVDATVDTNVEPDATESEETEPEATEPEETEPEETEPEKVKLTLNFPTLIYTNYPGVEFSYSFSDESKAEELTFTTNDRRVTIEDGKIVAKGRFASPRNVNITAQSENFKKTVAVKVMEFEGGLDLENKVIARQQQLESRSGGDTEGITLFVGDSFFNPDNWWTAFYSEYEGKKAYTVGISATTTSDWQMMSERLVYPYDPAAVVVNIGTNDIFDDGNDAATTAKSLKTLFETYHERLPETTVYWFTILPRVGKSFATPKAVNEQITEYAKDKDWLVVIDAASWTFEADGTTVKSSFFKDGVHPQNSNYELYRNALTEAGLVIPDKGETGSTAIADIVRDKSQNIGAGATAVVYRGKELVTEYVITGTFTLTEIANNGHAEFQFNTYKNRFLIWDKDNDKQLGVGWAQEGEATVNETANEEFTLGSEPLVIEFKLVFTAKNAYLYLDGKLKAVYYNVLNPTHLVLSTENMTATFSNIKAYTKTADAETYNTELAAVAEYEAQTGTDTRVVRVS